MNSYKTLFIVLIFSLITSLNAQTNSFVPMDENFTLLQKFFDTDTVLVVFPDSEPMSPFDKQEVEKFIFWGKGPIFVYKKESDIKRADLKKHIQLFGAINKFQKEYPKTPVKITEEGFIYNNEVFDKKNDAIYYLDDSATRLYTCINSKKTLNPFTTYSIGAYQFYIFRNNEIAYSGFINEITGENNINDLKYHKQRYFQNKDLSFFELNIAKKLNVDSVFNVSSKELDKYIVELCDHLEVDTNNIEKMLLYIYADRIELQKFIAAPLWSTVWGKCVGNVLHTANLNLPIVKHETAHSIIYQKIGFYSNAFFDEGFRQYTDYFFNEGAFLSDQTITKNNLELLNLELINGKTQFFFNPKNYNISGVFVKFLIDKISLSNFKKAFTQRRIEESFNEKYGLSLEELLGEFKYKIRNEGVPNKPFKNTHSESEKHCHRPS